MQFPFVRLKDGFFTTLLSHFSYHQPITTERVIMIVNEPLNLIVYNYTHGLLSRLIYVTHGLLSGMRFGKMQTTFGLAKILKHYWVEPTAKTETPVRLHPYAIMCNPLNGIYLGFNKRST